MVVLVVYLVKDLGLRIVKMHNNKIDMDNICKGCTEYERYIKDPARYGKCEGYTRKHVEGENILSTFQDGITIKMV